MYSYGGKKSLLPTVLYVWPLCCLSPWSVRCNEASHLKHNVASACCCGGFSVLLHSVASACCGWLVHAVEVSIMKPPIVLMHSLASVCCCRGLWWNLLYWLVHAVFVISNQSSSFLFSDCWLLGLQYISQSKEAVCDNIPFPCYLLCWVFATALGIHKQS